MTNVSELDRILRGVAAGAGIGSASFNEDGVCTFQYRDTVVILEIAEAARSLVIYAPLTPLAAVARGSAGDAEVLRTLLALNLSSADLLGATFALDADNDLVVLTYHLSLESLDQPGLERGLSHFLTLVDAWTGRLTRAEDLEQVRQRFTAEEAEDVEEQAPSEAVARPSLDELVPGRGPFTGFA